MSILRQDPTSEEWVLFATQRAKRPTIPKKEGNQKTTSSFKDTCPFCPGNESKTPPAVLTYKNSNQDSRTKWEVRGFPNKFPALSPDEEESVVESNSLFRERKGIGAHEVILDSPSHNRYLGDMGDQEVELVLRAYRDRYNALKADPRIKLILIFKNHGEMAGASIEHPHSQIVASPVVPEYIRRKYEIATKHFDKTGRCLYCDILKEELRLKKRVIMESNQFGTVQPYASRSPYETWIMPKKHRSSFGDTSDQEIKELSWVLKETLQRLSLHLNNPDFNFVIHTAPIEDEKKSYYLWHIQILPKLTTPAGFEIGSGIFINTSLPEDTTLLMKKDFSEISDVCVER